MKVIYSLNEDELKNAIMQWLESNHQLDISARANATVGITQSRGDRPGESTTYTARVTVEKKV